MDPLPGTASSPSARVASVPCIDASVTCIEEGRQRIDAIDDELHTLLRTRLHVSQQIQRLRIDDGGHRVEPQREDAIIGRWTVALGEWGPNVARAVLRLCRGEGH
jgi:chorismate mutase